MLFVTAGKRRKANRAEVTKLLLQYRTSKDAEKAARAAAEDARLALIGIAGDAEILVDKNGVIMAISGAVDAVWSAFDEIIGRGDCYLDGEDGIGVYAIEAGDYDY